jgi:xanthine dehydrogenase D subunit
MAAAARFRVLHAASIAEAVEWAVSIPGAGFVAGGTALQLEWSRGIAAPPTLIALGGMAGLKGVHHAGGAVERSSGTVGRRDGPIVRYSGTIGHAGGAMDASGGTVGGCGGTAAIDPSGGAMLRIGALTSLGELERDPRLATLPLLAASITGVAAPAVRNLATLGGNVAGRTGCLLPALLALDAKLVGNGPSGAWAQPLQHWLARGWRVGEIVEAIEIPAMPGGCRWTQRKIGLRAAFTPAMIGVAGVLEVMGGIIVSARLAVGGGMVAAARLPVSEALLVGQPGDSVDWPALQECLAAEISAPDDAFRSGRYRRLAACNALVYGLGGPLRTRRGTKQRLGDSSANAPAGEIRLARRAHPARWHARPDAAAKLTGSFAYLTDHRTADMLVGRILRAAHPHARIVSIDTARAEALPGVVAVVTHRDIRGLNAFGIVVPDQPALCHDKVRYVGDAVAAVAAVNADTAEAALRLIDVVYECLPRVTSAAQALERGAPLIHASGNLQRIIDHARGDVDAGFRGCTHSLEDVYITPRQLHGFMETEGGWAAVQPDGTLAIHAGGQHAHRDRLQLARLLGVPEEQIRVVTSPTGGAFGGKDELTVQPALALLAMKSRRPVRIQLTRAESVLAGTKRHPMVIRMRTGCDAEGRILAQEVDLLADAGAYASLGPSVLETALEHATGPYAIANVRTRGRLAYTNNGVCGAFRGFGANQMNFAVECQMDRLAARCRVSPLEIRRRNLKRRDGLGYFGQAVAPSERLADMLAAAAASPLWQRTRGASADEYIGVGMAMNHHGNGLGSVIPDPAGGRLRLAGDGRIEACFTLDEMGQGLLAAVLAIVAAQLGCGRDDIRPVTGGTANGPDSGSTTAARGTFVVWQAMRLAGPVFAAKLKLAAGRLLGHDAAGLTLAAGGIAKVQAGGAIAMSYAALASGLSERDRPTVDVEFEYPKADYSAGNARFLFASGACVARVAVSRITGEVRVLDLDQRSAAGPVVDVAAYLGQQEGGAVQGMGASLSEEAKMQDGAYLTANLDTYMMPSIADAPERMDVYALEDLDPGDDLGPRGVGELGIGAVSPAIANAVFDAIGVCPTTTPIAPEALIDAMDADR